MNDSGQLLPGRAGDSVFDFLYHDARRVGSFLAQFETYGVPSGVTATESAGRSTLTKTTAGAGLKVPALAKAEGALEVTSSDDERDMAERTYDPLWTNARALLDYLAARDLINRDLLTARLGQFVLASGTLIVLDVAMLKAAWEKPMVRRFVTQGARANVQGSAKGQSKSSRNGKQSDADLFLELLPVFPHSLQAHVVGADYSAWCSLAEASLVGMSSDVVLKHGSLVPGEWHVLGILDAVPDPDNDPGVSAGSLGHRDAAVVTAAGTAVGSLVAQLAPMARQFLGRPYTSYGLTPLLIFREVSG